MNDRNQYFGSIPIPKPIPKDETFSVLKVFNLALNLKFKLKIN